MSSLRAPIAPVSFLMSILERIRQRAAADPQRVVLPEGEDPRTVVAAAACAHGDIARVTVLGNEERVRAIAREAGTDLSSVEIIDHRRAADFEKMAALYYELRRAKGMMPDEARLAVADSLYYGDLMVRTGRADGSVAGATNTTAHTVRAALHCIGVRPGFKLVSSFFVMATQMPDVGTNGALIYADCGVVIDPSAAELAEIAWRIDSPELHAIAVRIEAGLDRLGDAVAAGGAFGRLAVNDVTGDRDDADRAVAFFFDLVLDVGLDLDAIEAASGLVVGAA